jgi:hypothetical protein
MSCSRRSRRICRVVRRGCEEADSAFDFAQGNDGKKSKGKNNYTSKNVHEHERSVRLRCSRL